MACCTLCQICFCFVVVTCCPVEKFGGIAILRVVVFLQCRRVLWCQRVWPVESLEACGSSVNPVWWLCRAMSLPRVLVVRPTRQWNWRRNLVRCVLFAKLFLSALSGFSMERFRNQIICGGWSSLPATRAVH